MELASRTQILTSKPDKLTVQDINAAANIVNRLLSKSNREENNQVRFSSFHLIVAQHDV